MCSFLLQLGLFVFHFEYEAAGSNKGTWGGSSERVLWISMSQPFLLDEKQK